VGEVQNPCRLPFNRRCSKSYGNSAGILEEIILSQDSERQGLVIDFDQAASMEKKKHEGFF
jgi:hypothetical protein